MTRTGPFVLYAALAACTGPSGAPPAAPAPARPAAVPPTADRPSAPPVAPSGLQLGDAVRPLRYALDLTLVPDRDRFSGVVDIEVELARRTSTILLHGDGLTVEAATFTAGGEPLPARAVPVPPDFIAFELARPADPGTGRLRVTYSAPLRAGESDGLYSEVEGGDRYIYTQFEATDARRAIPSFDEPRFKVPWTVSLHVKKEHVALANSPAVSETDEPGGMKVVRFAESKPLPSYLVALAVGPFEVVDAGVAGRNKTKVRIITPRGRAADARWAVQSTGPILEQLEAYFDSPYPYEKLDSIAVPQKGGAMENPGLITYGTNIILARAGDDTVARRRGYASICAHELAHMWFGDLVTMAWWDDLWLNEAFATWMARRIIDGWKPAWGGEATRVADRWTAMNADSLVSARLVRQPIRSQDDIESAFDRITYNKGAAVIFMFERWLGPEVFRRGVRRYLQQFAWRNATAADFLAAISAEAGRDVAPAFSTFLDQPGVPLVSAALTCSAGRPPVVSLSHARYLPAGSPGGAGNAVWQLPVCVRHPQGVECTMLSQAKAEMPLARARGCPAWLLANAGMNGYYRVHYQGDLWARLGRAWKKLTVPERVGLLDDLRALVVSGQVKYGDALAQLEPRVAAGDRHQLGAMIALAAGPHDILPGEDLRPAYAAWIRKAFGRRARALGWRIRAGEKEDQRLLRPKLAELVAVEGADRALVDEAGRLARRWLDDRRAVHPDVLEVVLVVAAQHGDRALFDRMHAAARKSDDRKERGHLFKAMGSFRDPAALRAALEVVVSGEFDPRQVAAIYKTALEDPHTRDAAWAFFVDHVDAIADRLPRNTRRHLVGAAEHFCDADRREAVKKLFAGRGQSERVTAQTLEKIDLCRAQRDLHAASLRAFLAGARRAPAAAPSL